MLKYELKKVFSKKVNQMILAIVFLLQLSGVFLRLEVCVMLIQKGNFM